MWRLLWRLHGHCLGSRHPWLRALVTCMMLRMQHGVAGLADAHHAHVRICVWQARARAERSAAIRVAAWAGSRVVRARIGAGWLCCGTRFCCGGLLLLLLHAEEGLQVLVVLLLHIDQALLLLLDSL